MCCRAGFFFFFKQKTAYEMRISDWSSDVCSSDLILEDRMDRKFDRDAARIADAVAHPACEIEVDAVARRQIAARLRDADDRPPVAKLGRRQPVIHEPFEIQRGHIGAGGIGEPVARAEAALGHTDAHAILLARPNSLFNPLSLEFCLPGHW